MSLCHVCIFGALLAVHPLFLIFKLITGYDIIIQMKETLLKYILPFSLKSLPIHLSMHNKEIGGSHRIPTSAARSA